MSSSLPEDWERGRCPTRGVGLPYFLPLRGLRTQGGEGRAVPPRCPGRKRGPGIGNPGDTRSSSGRESLRSSDEVGVVQEYLWFRSPPKDDPT